MNEYIKRKRAIVDACNSLELYPSEYVKLEDALNKIPAADVVEVVRCKDCKFFEKAEYYPDGFKCVCRLLHRQMQDDDFCSYGERKDGEQ